MKKSVRYCQYLNSMNRRRSMIIVGIGIALLLGLACGLLLGGASAKMRFWVLVEMPFRLWILTILIYAATGFLLKSWLVDKKEVKSIAENPLTQGGWKHTVLVAHITAETAALVFAGVVSGVVFIVLLYSSLIFGKS